MNLNSVINAFGSLLRAEEALPVVGGAYFPPFTDTVAPAVTGDATDSTENLQGSVNPGKPALPEPA